LVPFGAFARVAEGLEGLIHISELARYLVATTADTVQKATVCVCEWWASTPTGDGCLCRSGRPTPRKRTTRTYNRSYMATWYASLAQDR